MCIFWFKIIILSLPPLIHPDAFLAKSKVAVHSKVKKVLMKILVYFLFRSLSLFYINSVRDFSTNSFFFT